jgi:hypothetical protein
VNDADAALSIHAEGDLSHARPFSIAWANPRPSAGDLHWNKTVLGFDMRTAGAREVHAGCPKNRRRRLSMNRAKRS